MRAFVHARTCSECAHARLRCVTRSVFRDREGEKVPHIPMETDIKKGQEKQGRGEEKRIGYYLMSFLAYSCQNPAELRLVLAWD